MYISFDARTMKIINDLQGENAMHFKPGAEVLTADGRKVGRVKSVIINPRTSEVSGLIVERGFLLTEEKVLPLSWIGHTEGETTVTLTAGVDKFDELESFQERDYTPVDETNGSTNVTVLPTYYPYGSPGYYPMSMAFGNAVPVIDTMATASDHPQYVETTHENIPSDTVTVNVNARVLSSDDKHVGNVESVFTSDTGKATHMLVNKGLFFKTRKLIPTDWISTASDDVHLSVTADRLDRLPDYDTYDWRVREVR